jgi:hypothetical protein
VPRRSKWIATEYDLPAHHRDSLAREVDRWHASFAVVDDLDADHR